MIDLTQETLLTIPQAARLIPSDGKAGHVHVSTIWRWIQKGASAGERGRVTLECIKVGGRVCTSAEALQRFSQAREVPASEQPEVPVPTSQRVLFSLREAGIIPEAPCAG